MKLGNLIADCALRYPEREVIICNDRRITFGELEITANRLANAYTARGMKTGDRLAMFLPNSAELIEAMCGAAKAGGTSHTAVGARAPSGACLTPWLCE